MSSTPMGMDKPYIRATARYYVLLPLLTIPLLTTPCSPFPGPGAVSAAGCAATLTHTLSLVTMPVTLAPSQT